MELKMPTPLTNPPKLKRGPTPNCECGKCPTCKNRLRQKRYYERNLVKVRGGEDKEYFEEEEEE